MPRDLRRFHESGQSHFKTLQLLSTASPISSTQRRARVRSEITISTAQSGEKRGLVKEPGDWKWSSFRHYAFRKNGVVEIESEWTVRDRELKMSGGPPRIFLCPG